MAEHLLHNSQVDITINHIGCHCVPGLMRYGVNAGRVAHFTKLAA